MPENQWENRNALSTCQGENCLISWNGPCYLGGVMQGLITERDFDAMEAVFPGIRQFYDESRPKPFTFLELLWKFEGRHSRLARPKRRRFAQGDRKLR
jgi:hypothetical protein